MQTLFPNVFWVSVTGSICAGKSTLIEALKGEYRAGNLPENTVFVREPHENPLSLAFGYKKAYFNPKINAEGKPEDPTVPFKFQVAVLQDYYNLVKNISEQHYPDPVLVITERSHIDAGIFWEQLFGHTSNREHTSLIHTREDLYRGRTPDFTVNLLVRVDTALERANKRLSETPSKKGETGKFLKPETFRFLCAEYANFGNININAYHKLSGSNKTILNAINQQFNNFVSNYANPTPQTNEHAGFP